MKKFLLIMFLVLGGATAPVWAQKQGAYKARSAKLAAAAARDKAARTKSVANTSQPVTEGPEVAELLRIEEAWAQATIQNNAEVITHLLAEEYVAVNSQGAVTNKADVLSAIANDDAKCDINKAFDFIVRVYGNTGLVIHNTSFRGTLRGVATNGEYRTMHMYVKRGGKWLVVANQTTFVAPARMTVVSRDNPENERERKRKKGREVAGQ
ncbi:nuclear transport factor 2 family protein [Hymenobacter terrenus]|uniref:nuclear transport factor 2 family protein n=1 Tax=Hymenobacter terrenus TaxID=1629124 RepID=UPI0006193502|nr:nuclear transport factor 2 family protein [Hymenobacter terrenus]